MEQNNELKALDIRNAVYNSQLYHYSGKNDTWAEELVTELVDAFGHPAGNPEADRLADAVEDTIHICIDYDGYKTVDELKGLIDEIRKYCGTALSQYRKAVSDE